MDKLTDLWDKVLDFIEDHKVVAVIIGVVVIIAILALIIRGVNLSKKQKELAELQEQPVVEEVLPESTTEVEEPKSQYQVNLGLQAETDGRIEYEEPEPTPEPTPEVVVETKPSYDTMVRIFDSTAVPKVNVDGSSCKSYQDKITLADFGTNWGTALTEEDYNTSVRYLVGVEQNKNDFEKGDLMSVGWLSDNLSTLSDETAIKFTNLHVIGSLSSTHTALLCSYDWYSAYGLKDTLVVFEDMSGTLDMTKFTDGAIFSATVFAHNVKVLDDVAGQRVLCVQYNIFD